MRLQVSSLFSRFVTVYIIVFLIVSIFIPIKYFVGGILFLIILLIIWGMRATPYSYNQMYIKTKQKDGVDL